MHGADDLSALIGDIYDASLDATVWPRALLRIRDYVGGQAATIFWKDAAAQSGAVSFEDGGIDRHFVDLYFSRYVKLDPASTGHFFAEIGQPTATADLIAYDEFLQTRFYREWARPQGLVDFVSVVLEKSQASVAMFGVFRHERHGVADETAKHRMRLIAPHVRRAALIGKTIQTGASETVQLSEVLDRISAGIFLVDAAGHVVHANSSGSALLAAGDFLCSRGGRLVARDAKADHGLHDMIVAASHGDIALGAKGIALPLIAPAGERYIAHVLPLTSGRRRQAGSAAAAVTALFVHKAAIAPPSLPEIIATCFRLTPTELRVLLAVVEVGGGPDVAEALGVAETTVKSHLRQLFEKTNTHRQADLVKLVAGFANPLVD